LEFPNYMSIGRARVYCKPLHCPSLQDPFQQLFLKLYFQSTSLIFALRLSACHFFISISSLIIKYLRKLHFFFFFLCSLNFSSWLLCFSRERTISSCLRINCYPISLCTRVLRLRFQLSYACKRYNNLF